MSDKLYPTVHSSLGVPSQFAPIQRELGRPTLIDRVVTRNRVSRIRREGFLQVYDTAVEEAVSTAQHEIVTAGQLMRLNREKEVEQQRVEMVSEVQKGRNMATREVSATASTHDNAILNAHDQEVAELERRFQRGEITEARYQFQRERLARIADDELKANLQAKDICFELVDRGLRAVTGTKAGNGG
ncbi:hypothetical protein [Rhodovulum sp. PH10]|uniref:hypothetical protein n=1 Tax=Rhodovulum sp. PH10 TaxID=1187851 RepID=UPI0012FB6510|nr:hypothetical protein [Rhodovulum sp. PH10]